MNRAHVAIAILAGSGLVAASLMLIGIRGNEVPAPAANLPQTEQLSVIPIPERSQPAFYYGNSEAEIVIVEFSDLKCPFCARLHPILKTLVDQSAGTIRWEYRHLPSPRNSESLPSAIASECVGKQLGAADFFTYLERLYPFIGSYSRDLYIREAVALGVEEAGFVECLSNPEIETLVNADAAAALDLGARGTPFSIVKHLPSGNSQIISGAQPIENWREVIAVLTNQ